MKVEFLFDDLKISGRSEVVTVVNVIAIFDSDDTNETNSTNDQKLSIKLTSNRCSFIFPTKIERPHPDILGFIALKLFSPYIGSRLVLDQPVSHDFENAAIKAYPNLQRVSSSSQQKKREVSGENPGISFSGGVDSVAVASLMPADTPLVQLVRMQHPKLPNFERWYKTKANISTMESLFENSAKYTVYSDMEFLSTNGRWCIYPDTYAFTIPLMFMADTLQLTHVLTGDIWVAFTGDETIFNPNLEYRRSYLFNAMGLPIQYPCNGIGEIGTYKLAENFIGSKKCTTCQYGEFMKPCMKCVKCFRKTLYDDAFSNSSNITKNIKKLNESPSIINLAKDQSRKGRSFMPSIKLAFENVNYSHQLDGAVNELFNRAKNCQINPNFCEKIYMPAYAKDEDLNFIANARDEILKYLDPMNEQDIASFESLHWEKNWVN